MLSIAAICSTLRSIRKRPLGATKRLTSFGYTATVPSRSTASFLAAMRLLLIEIRDGSGELAAGGEYPSRRGPSGNRLPIHQKIAMAAAVATKAEFQRGYRRPNRGCKWFGPAHGTFTPGSSFPSRIRLHSFKSLCSQQGFRSRRGIRKSTQKLLRSGFSFANCDRSRDLLKTRCAPRSAHARRWLRKRFQPRVSVAAAGRYAGPTSTYRPRWQFRSEGDRAPHRSGQASGRSRDCLVEPVAGLCGLAAVPQTHRQEKPVIRVTTRGQLHDALDRLLRASEITRPRTSRTEPAPGFRTIRLGVDDLPGQIKHPPRRRVWVDRQVP